MDRTTAFIIAIGLGRLMIPTFIMLWSASAGSLFSGAPYLSGCNDTEIVMRAVLRALEWLFIFPGEWLSNRLGVTKADNRDLVRMLINSLFWIASAVIGLAIWTSQLPIYD